MRLAAERLDLPGSGTLALHGAMHEGMVRERMWTRMDVWVRVLLDHAHPPSNKAVVIILCHRSVVCVLLHLSHGDRLGMSVALAFALLFLLFFLLLTPLLTELLELCKRI